MTSPDSTNAFDADAGRENNAEVETLRRRISELEGRDNTVVDESGEVEVIDPNNPSGHLDDVEEANSATVAGTTWHFHTPKQAALMAFGLGTANRRDGQLMMRTMQNFLQFHLLEADFERLLERMTDPSDDFGDEEFGDLMNAVVESATDSAEARAPKNGPRN